MSDIGADPVFKGHTPGGISCEDFVQAVRKYAIVKNKARDDGWIADFVMSCLSGDALHWSEDLSKDVQGDWSLLRRALLAEYGSANRKYASGVAMLPIPAVAPRAAQLSLANTSITTPQCIRGRIRVVASGFTGYLANELEENEKGMLRWLCLGFENVSHAGILSGTMANGGLQFKFENLDPGQSDLGVHLGVIWPDGSPPLDTDWAALTVVQVHGSTTSSNEITAWKGPATWVTWIRSPDNTLTPKIEGMPDAGVLMYYWRILVAANVDERVKRSHEWRKARFVFEPI